jgi:hypothetical protein
MRKQLQALKEYGQKAYESNAHIGLAFYIVVIALGVILYNNM